MNNKLIQKRCQCDALQPLRPPDVAPVDLGCFGQICTAGAQKLLFSASSKIVTWPLDSAIPISLKNE